MIRERVYFSTSQAKAEKVARAYGPGHFAARTWAFGAKVKYGWGVFKGKM